MAIEGQAGELAGKQSNGKGVSRRTVLATAAAGAAGIAAIRIIGGELLAPAARTGSRQDWVSPLGASEAARVKHLLRRTSFGAAPSELERALTDGYAKTVERLVETPAAAPPPLAGADEASRINQLKVGDLQRWWVDWMTKSPTPFAEAMTLFWHGHFTSDYRKVGAQAPYIYWQNLTWRANALGDFSKFLYDVTVDPAMLRYLDLATSTGKSPNENYSRELMELFTMGPGNYTEDDVRAAAKALAGWREPRTAAIAEADSKNPNLSSKQQAAALASVDPGRSGVFDPKRAFVGDLTFLGKTGRFDTRAVLDRILAQKATAPFIVTRVVTHFVMPNPSADYVKRLAEGFVRSKWSIKQLMHDVLTSPEFVSDSAYRSLIKSPTEVMVSALKALGGDVRTAMQFASPMGQQLFDPPDVGGWPTNEAWISSNTVLARVNLATAMTAAKSVPAAGTAHRDHLDGVLSPATAAALSSATDDRQRWFSVLASPEFQLK